MKTRVIFKMSVTDHKTTSDRFKAIDSFMKLIGAEKLETS
jgi:hypothetical protein